ncbi:MAG: hypothetical protein Q8910_01320 [Bacteroidota bacterium]|nr:hypothetical protein [Bacteroidota bacterium]
MITVIDPGVKEIKFWSFEGDSSINRELIKESTRRINSHKGLLASTFTELNGTAKPDAIALRLLFGGDQFGESVLVDKSFFPKFNELLSVRPAYVAAVGKFIEILYAEFPNIPVIAFFETGLFLNLPEADKYYAVPYDYLKETDFRRWGFQGLWHKYNSAIPSVKSKVISIVLDDLTTICSVNNGQPMTISFGGTPLEGIMGRRTCGDLDPGLVFHLMKNYNYSIFKIDDILKKKSGFLGLSGYDEELDKLFLRYEKDPKVKFTFDIYKGQIFKYIGEAITGLDGVNSIVFSGKYAKAFNPFIKEILDFISFLGIKLKDTPWESSKREFEITEAGSEVRCFLNYRPLPEIVSQMAQDVVKELFVQKEAK